MPLADWTPIEIPNGTDVDHLSPDGRLQAPAPKATSGSLGVGTRNSSIISRRFIPTAAEEGSIMSWFFCPSAGLWNPQLACWFTSTNPAACGGYVFSLSASTPAIYRVPTSGNQQAWNNKSGATLIISAPNAFDRPTDVWFPARLSWAKNVDGSIVLKGYAGGVDFASMTKWVEASDPAITSLGGSTPLGAGWCIANNHEEGIRYMNIDETYLYAAAP